MKLSTLDEVIKDKRVAVIDDSIVRGTTSKQIVKMLFDAGAKEVHFLVVSPPVKFPDFYGIDTDTFLSMNSRNEAYVKKHFEILDSISKGNGLEDLDIRPLIKLH
jgi:amidophosphoribosyltransferase